MIKNFFARIKFDLIKVCLEVFVYPKYKRALLKAKYTKKFLQKYANIAVSTPFDPIAEEQTKIIWQYWHQGVENAPEVIKKCLASVQKFEGDKTINILSLETIKDYIELPQRYYDLVNSGKMPIALFSDVLRVNLLQKYGGTWIDSTVYLTRKLPQEIFESDLFGYRMDFERNWTQNKTPCWFIHSKKNSANIQAIKRALDAYWTENDGMFNYFMFEHLQTILSDKTPELNAEWDKMPYISMPASKLRGLLDKPFDEESWEEILQNSGVHKLTYRSKKSSVEQVEDSFLKHL